MPTATRTFRVFISSTFEDLRAERNILQEKVFPELERFCLEKGARFQAIDLRWGVREEAGLDQKTMEICLAEIARCQKTRIKPNFIVLLGDRYGWRPLPARIQQDEFESVLAHIANTGERDFVASWYDLDRNAVPPEYLLKPRTGIYTDWGEWEPVEQRLHRVLGEGARAAGLSPHSLIKYEASATHQEILKGLGETTEDRAHVFAFLRESGGYEDPELTKLKDHLKAVLPAENVFPWSAGDHPRLCDYAERSLKTIIGATAAQFETQSEKVSHDRFADDRAKHFKGREIVLDAIEQYLLGEDRRPLVVFGPSGSGKSAIMAVASEGKNAIRRFIGATPESSSGITLLRGLCREFGERFGQTGDLPATFNELSTMFAQRLKLATVEQPVILFIDALDQLSAQDPAAAMRWLPAELPPYCHVVLSTTQIPEALRRAAMVAVEPLPVDDASRALDAWLTEAGRTLQPEQREKLLARFLQSGLPLYLKLAFEEARLWRSLDPPGFCVLGEGLPGIIDRLFARLYDPANHGRVLVGHALGYLTAARYGLTEGEILAVLTKDDVVWKDVVGEGARRRHDPPSRQLPVIVWSRLHLDLEPYLTERTVPGGTTVSFYHRQLAERVEATPLHHNALATHFAGQSHWLSANVPNRRKLTELIRQQVGAGLVDDAADVLTDLDFVSAKCAAELVFDLEEDYRAAIAALPEAQAELKEEKHRDAELERWTDELTEYSRRWSEWRRRRPIRGFLAILFGWPSSAPALRSPNAVCSIPPWTDERAAAEIRRIISDPNRLDRVRAFAEFVKRQSFSLGDFGTREGYVVQEALNDSSGGLVHNIAQTQVGRLRVPALLRQWPQDFFYNPKPTLERTLEGHTGAVHAVAIRVDGHRAVSASGDGTLKVWDLETGRAMLTLVGHAGGVLDVAVSANGRRAVSASEDLTLKVWDLETGAIVGTLKGHSNWVNGVAITADGKRAVSASYDETLKVWDLETSRNQYTLVGHSGSVNDVVLSADGHCAVSASSDGTVRVWNLETGRETHLVFGQIPIAVCADGRQTISALGQGTAWDLENGPIARYLRGANCGAISADGRVAVTSKGQMLHTWNLETGQEYLLGGHSKKVLGVAVTADGQRAISASEDSLLKMWSLERGHRGEADSAPSASISGIWTSDDGHRAVSTSADALFTVWDVEACRVRLVQRRSPESSEAPKRPSLNLATRSRDSFEPSSENFDTISTALVAVSGDGRRAIAETSERPSVFSQFSKKTSTFTVWDLEAGRELHTLGKKLLDKSLVRISASGSHAVILQTESFGLRSSLQEVWDLDARRELAPGGVWKHRAELDGKLNAPARRKLGLGDNWVGRLGDTVVTSDGRTAVSACDSVLKVWDLASGSERFTLTGHISEIHRVALSPDGQNALSVSGDALKVWSLNARRELCSLTGDMRYSIKVSANWRRAVSWSQYSSEHPLTVWDLETDRPVLTLTKPAGILDAALSADGSRVIIASSDSLAEIWDLERGIRLALVRAPINSVEWTVIGRIVAGTFVGEILFYDLYEPVGNPLAKV